MLCKEYRCNLQDKFRLTGCAISMASLFGVTCARCGQVISSRVLALHSVVAGSILRAGVCQSFWSL